MDSSSKSNANEARPSSLAPYHHQTSFLSHHIPFQMIYGCRALNPEREKTADVLCFRVPCSSLFINRLLIFSWTASFFLLLLLLPYFIKIVTLAFFPQDHPNRKSREAEHMKFCSVCSSPRAAANTKSRTTWSARQTRSLPSYLISAVSQTSTRGQEEAEGVKGSSNGQENVPV